MYKKLNKCRCCLSENIEKYLDLGQQPLANSYHKGEKLDLFPLEVDLCKDCFHSQLSIVVEPSLMFKNYLYVSGTTKTFRDHCNALAEDAILYWEADHKTKPSVLDIACNDGTLLKCFKDKGCSVQGVDPAENLRVFTEEKDIPVEVGYWGQKVADNLGYFDVITGTNVFAHVDDVDAFLETCHSSLTPNGVVILEFPYCDEMIEKVEFDTIYHEHLSYFLVNSFTKLANRKNFFIDRILRTPIHGGSIRFFLKKGKFQNCEEVDKLIQEEISKGLLEIETYVMFASEVDQNKINLNQKLQELKQKGYKTIGFGASAKGNTMLNYFEIDLDYIVDNNSMKWDYLTPGRNIPICDPELMAKEEQNLAIVILSWNFFKEIKSKIREIRKEREDIYILYVPKVQEA